MGLRRWLYRQVFGHVPVSKHVPVDSKRLFIWVLPGDLTRAGSWLLPPRECRCRGCRRLAGERGDGACFLKLVADRDRGSLWHVHPLLTTSEDDELNECWLTWLPRCWFADHHLSSGRRGTHPRLFTQRVTSDGATVRSHPWAQLADVLVISAEAAMSEETAEMIRGISALDPYVSTYKTEVERLENRLGSLEPGPRRRIRLARQALEECKANPGAYQAVAIMNPPAGFLNGASPVAQAVEDLAPTVFQVLHISDPGALDELRPYLSKEQPLARLQELMGYAFTGERR